MSADPGLPPPDAPGEEFGLAKGATIGRYVVLGVLGRGGMGEVYAAFDPDLDRKIAVKLLRARRGTNTADGRARLLREAQAIARLSHPNVVVVFDVGTFRESVFIAMEFVEGHTLGYWIQAQARGWREVLQVYTAAGRGLAAAHEAGLVHRDFKPDNVMITKSGQVRVMDFGLARELGAADEPSPANVLAASVADRAAALAETFDAGADVDATAKLGSGSHDVPTSSGGYLKVKLTQTGAMLGTPAYMAPEQFAGTSSDARTDQFSFCVALYESLYGQRPFAGQNAIQLMANVVAGTIADAPPDARVPTWIRKILLRGLATNPRDRYPSMTELLAALGQDPATRRRRWLAAAAGLGLLTAAAAGAHRFSAGHQSMCAGGPDRASAAWGRDRRVAIERAFASSGNVNAARAFAGVSSLIDDYVGRWVAMYKDSCEATHVRGEQSAEVLDLRMACLAERLSSVRALGDVFSTADAAVVDNAVAAASTLPSLDRCADTEMLRAVIKPPEDPAARAKVAALREEVARVRALGDSGQCEKAVVLGTKATQDAKALGYLPVQAEADFAAGRLIDTCLDPSKGVAFLEDAATAAETSRHDQLFVEATVVLAAMYADRLRDIPRAQDNVRHSRAVLARIPGHKLLEAWVDEAESIIELEQGNYERALPLERRAYELRSQIYPGDHYELTNSLTNLGLELHGIGRDGEAEPVCRQAVDMAIRLFGPASARTAMLRVNLAEILTALGRFDEAQRSAEAALATFRRQATGPYLVAYALLDLGRVQFARGNASQAVSTLEESVGLMADQDGAILAEAKFALAQALWAASPRSRVRARDLAAAARALAAKRMTTKRLLGEIESWQAAHAPA
ncbi:MAG TPA: serine/threonine-protein kinase [Polyangia bacterium]|nr:serine/threonine-protein kinase [Polyangia bacterium]